MTREEDGELDIPMEEEGRLDAGGDAMEAAALEEELAEKWVRRPLLPWIGALENPHLGPMVVLNESGYLVPLLTAGDLLRGCKYYWHRSQG
jgi:hypothetical protein